jgi:hypothetical protein
MKIPPTASAGSYTNKITTLEFPTRKGSGFLHSMEDDQG